MLYVKHGGLTPESLVGPIPHSTKNTKGREGKAPPPPPHIQTHTAADRQQHACQLGELNTALQVLTNLFHDLLRVLIRNTH